MMEVSSGLGTKQRLRPIQNAIEARFTVSMLVSMLEAGLGSSVFFERRASIAKFRYELRQRQTKYFFHEVTDDKGSTFSVIC